MRYGIYAPNFGAFGDARAVMELARSCEAAGWDGLFLWDHIARGFATDVVDPWVALAAAATSTTRLQLGALVTPLSRRRPWKLARETVSLDRLSGGRLTFGVGLGSSGGRDAEWAAFDEEMDLRRRGEQLDEGLEVLTRLWSGDPVSFRGKHYEIESAGFLPVPLQRPRIPIWVAGTWPGDRPFRRAARFDGVFPLFHRDGRSDATPEALADCVRFVAEARGNSDFDVAHLAPPTPGADPARAAEQVAPFAAAGATWWLERLTPDEFGGSWAETWPIEAMLERVHQGPPR